MKALTKAQATHISELLNSVFVWEGCCDRELMRRPFNREDFDKCRKWADAAKDGLREYGIKFASDKN